jgi:hypothetical protein
MRSPGSTASLSPSLPETQWPDRARQVSGGFHHGVAAINGSRVRARTARRREEIFVLLPLAFHTFQSHRRHPEKSTRLLVSTLAKGSGCEAETVDPTFTFSRYPLQDVQGVKEPGRVEIEVGGAVRVVRLACGARR